MVPLEYSSRTTVIRDITTLRMATRSEHVKQILRCDWLPEQIGRGYVPRYRLPKIFLIHILNFLLTGLFNEEGWISYLLNDCFLVIEQAKTKTFQLSWPHFFLTHVNRIYILTSQWHISHGAFFQDVPSGLNSNPKIQPWLLTVCFQTSMEASLNEKRENILW